MSQYEEGFADASFDIKAEAWTIEQAKRYLSEVQPLDDDYDRGHRAAIQQFALSEGQL